MDSTSIAIGSVESSPESIEVPKVDDEGKQIIGGNLSLVQ